MDIPVHFYGELARTPAGIKLMKENGDYNWFVSLLASPNSTSLEKRGALWAVGHIGSVKFGLKELLLQSDVFSLILSLADGCPCLATRGFVSLLFPSPSLITSSPLSLLLLCLFFHPYSSANIVLKLLLKPIEHACM